MSDGSSSKKRSNSLDSKSIDKKQPRTMATEQTPLLRSRSPSVGQIVDIVDTKVMSPRTIITITIVILVVVQMGDQLMEPSFTRVFESIYCYNYWEVEDPSKILLSRANVGPGAIGGVDEQWCKVAKVQSQVATLRGYQSFLEGIPSLILAIPFGIIADKCGRKYVLIPVMCSFPAKAAWMQIVCWFWQSFDIRMTWLSSLHALFGGSSGVASALYYCVISDVSNVNARAPLFFALTACAMIANFFSYPVAAYGIAINPWLPLLSGLALMVIPIPLLLALPETLNYQHHTLETKPPSLSDMQDESSPPSSDPAPASTALISRCKTLLKEATHFAFADWRIASLASTFALHYLSMATATTTLLQYASTRYHLSFSRATLLLSIRAGSMILVLLVLLPLPSTYMVRSGGYSPARKDLILARASAVATATGFGLIALAPSVGAFVPALVVLTFGAGFASLVRSFLTSLVRAGDTAKLYTVISVVDTAGLMAGSPLFALLFEVGLGIGGMGLGMPFWVLGGLFAGVAGLMFLVGTRDVDAGVEAEEGLTTDSDIRE